MVRKIIILLSLLLPVLAAGCSSAPATVTTTQASGVRQVRQAELGGKWVMKQLEINLESDMSVLMTLEPGDTVEGYFYLVKGNNVGFEISGESLIYKSVPAAGSDNITSDRFSFTASDTQGIAYTLKLFPDDVQDDGKATDTTVFVEMVYPSSGEMFVPMGTR